MAKTLQICMMHGTRVPGICSVIGAVRMVRNGHDTNPVLHHVGVQRRRHRSPWFSSNIMVIASCAASVFLPGYQQSIASVYCFPEAFVSTSCRRRIGSRAYPTIKSSSKLTANNSDNEKETNNASSDIPVVASDIFTRFTSPIIDDPGLPLSDVLVAQVIAPSLQIAWISSQHAPQPSWLQPIFDSSLLYSNRGVLLAPALIHGAALASCWITGALAAKAYERKSISPVPIKSLSSSTLNKVEWDYSNVLLAIFKSGAFAVGLLIFATQIDLFLEYKRYVQVGESDDIDFRLLVALVEIINDCVFEAVTISTWRLFLAYQTERMSRD